MRPALTCCIAGEVRPIVLKCFDISKHLRGSGMVDKIKKYRRDIPRRLSLTSAVDCHLGFGDNQWPR